MLSRILPGLPLSWRFYREKNVSMTMDKNTMLYVTVPVHLDEDVSSVDVGLSVICSHRNRLAI